MTRFFSESQRTPAHEALLTALHTGVETLGYDATHRAFAEVMSPHYLAHWAAYWGLKESHTGKRCACRVMGKRCRNDLCPRPPGTEHDSIWLYKGKGACYVSQPYSLDAGTLKRMALFAEQSGLHLTIRGWGAWHFPGDTLFVTWWNRAVYKTVIEEFLTKA